MAAITDGVSYRETLEGLRDRAKTPQRVAELESELALPPLPAAVLYLWTIFLRLHNRRGSNGMGPSPISWADLDSFIRLSGFNLAPWEIEIIEELDGVFFAEQAKATKPS